MTDDTGDTSTCDRCREPAEGPLATITTDASGTVQHHRLCQACAATGPRYCHRCDKLTLEPIAVGIKHSMSGPGWTLHACPACHVRPTVDTPAARLAAALARRGH